MKPITRVQLCRHLSDVFPVRNGWKQRDASSPLLIYFALDSAVRTYFALDSAIRTVQINQDGFKLSDTHQVLVYADDVNILGGSICGCSETFSASTLDGNTISNIFFP
jgi:hypothetical protein